jgi:hypothetical protein
MAHQVAPSIAEAKRANMEKLSIAERYSSNGSANHNFQKEFRVFALANVRFRDTLRPPLER